MDIVTRKQLNILIQLAEADKHFSPIERERIIAIAKSKNFPEEEVKELIKNPEPIESFGALSMEQRYDYLYSCVELMLSDKRVFESELMFCKSIAIKLDFKKSVIDFLNEEFHNHSKEELKKIIYTNYV